MTRVLTLISIAALTAAALACSRGDDDAATPDGRRTDAPAAGADAPAGTPDAPPVTMADASEPTPDGPVAAVDAGPSSSAGDTCATATTITAGTLSSTTSGLTDDYASVTCGGPGPDGVFAIAVPAGRPLRAMMIPESVDFDAELALVTTASCSGVLDACLTHQDVGLSGEPERIVYQNTGASEEIIDIVVDGFGPDDHGAFTLVTSTAPLPAGDTCEGAIPLVSVTGASTFDALDDHHPTGVGCHGGYPSEGPDLVYAATIPAGQTLTVVATPGEPYFDLTLNLLARAATCLPDAACLVGEDVGYGGDAETLTYENVSGAAMDVYLIVDGYRSFSTGTYDLTVTMM